MYASLLASPIPWKDDHDIDPRCSRLARPDYFVRRMHGPGKPALNLDMRDCSRDCIVSISTIRTEFVPPRAARGAITRSSLQEQSGNRIRKTHDTKHRHASASLLPSL